MTDMKECTCDWNGHPTWMHDAGCEYRKDRDESQIDRFVMLRVALTEPMTFADARRVGARLVEAVNVDEDVQQTFYLVNEGDGTDLGM